METDMNWHAPLDPECTAVRKYLDALYNDPMSEGAPLDDIVQGFERSHRRKCTRCQTFGAANIEVI
jgi:hypothetical protein